MGFIYESFTILLGLALSLLGYFVFDDTYIGGEPHFTQIGKSANTALCDNIHLFFDSI